MLAILLERVRLTFSTNIPNFQSFNVFRWKKCVKLVNEVIIVINGVPTTYLWRKNEAILSEKNHEHNK